MSDVVDSDELLRRIQRARRWAQEQERAWRGRGEEGAVRAVVYETVGRVLDEILTPGAR
ncbi:hypothetical protein QFZ63_000973 [Streptomyces sp. B3I7]|uniref:hypothetical protein n=1 Tax=Streptomyces sp. B3I7 TaxID=3042269 RepID=UPI002783C4E5|nr:hypothetical protein [Streptomyces sp. B3I7]MDQ0809259.1 hypothetical protein [Streptomyces sp. B3I7]